MGLFGFLDNKRVCPWWMTYSFDNPLRHLIHDPRKILKDLVKPGDTVMDVGCGFGYFTIGMAGMVEKDGLVVAVDLQERSLNMVRERAQKAGMKERILTHLATPSGINYSGKVDFILTFWMVHEIPNQALFFKELVSMLEPGAKYLLVEPLMHVSKGEFQETINNAIAMGLKPIGDLKVALSRAQLFTI
jgi:cyclopropane fatty-acyl-phospholipid synthase-like methyltransferase